MCSLQVNASSVAHPLPWNCKHRLNRNITTLSSLPPLPWRSPVLLNQFLHLHAGLNPLSLQALCLFINPLLSYLFNLPLSNGSVLLVLEHARALTLNKTRTNFTFADICSLLPLMASPLDFFSPFPHLSFIPEADCLFQRKPHECKSHSSHSSHTVMDVGFWENLWVCPRQWNEVRCFYLTFEARS